MSNLVKKICIIGFGSSSKAFCEILIDKHDSIKESTGFDLQVVAIATKTKGSLLSNDGLDLNEVLEEVKNLGKFDDSNPSIVSYSVVDLIHKSKADIVIELSTLSIIDGQPAIKHIETSMQAGANVITANKGPLAWAYNKLKKLSKVHDVQFLYETTVMDGTPIFNLTRETLPGCKILGFRGILNSTTNFILEEMEKGSTFDSSIKVAQANGFVEADPSLDIDGWDAAAKTAVLINILMEGNLTPMDIQRTGIADISLEDVTSAFEQGQKIKLLCEGYIETNNIIGKVHPVHIDNKDIFSLIDSTSSIISIETDLMGTISIVEQNPEIQQTAYGIFSDLLTVLKRG